MTRRFLLLAAGGLLLTPAVALASRGLTKFSGQETGDGEQDGAWEAFWGQGRAPHWGDYGLTVQVTGGLGAFEVVTRRGMFGGTAAVRAYPEADDRQGVFTITDGGGDYDGISGSLWWYAELSDDETYAGTLYGYPRVP